MLEKKRVQKPRDFWISIAYFRASTVYVAFIEDNVFDLDKKVSIRAYVFA